MDLTRTFIILVILKKEPLLKKKLFLQYFKFANGQVLVLAILQTLFYSTNLPTPLSCPVHKISENINQNSALTDQVLFKKTYLQLFVNAS